MRIVLAALILALSFAPLRAQTFLPGDHLEPEDSILGRGYSFDRYYEKLVAAFEAAFAREVRARMLVISSFEPEYVVALRRDGGVFTILALRPDEMLWQYESLNFMEDGSIQVLHNDESAVGENEATEPGTETPRAVREIPVARCEMVIDPALGLRVERLWHAMLVQTRFFPPPQPGPPGQDEPVLFTGDGIAYHFSLRTDYGLLAGHTWNVSAQSNTGLLVSAGKIMGEACRTGDASHLARLQTQIETLESRFPVQ